MERAERTSTGEQRGEPGAGVTWPDEFYRVLREFDVTQFAYVPDAGHKVASGPRVLLLDEPTEGLQPSLVERILDTVAELRSTGTTMLLVEQKVEAALAVADRIAFIENGRIREHATPESLARDPEPLIRYVGVHRAE